MLGLALDVVAAVLLTFASLLACLLLPLQADSLKSVRRGDLNAGSDPAGYGMGQGYLFVAALGGALCAVIGLLLSRRFWIWSTCVLAAHALVVVLGQIQGRVRDRLSSSRVSGLERCPHCGVAVRADRLSRHIHRVHPQGPAESRGSGPRRP